MKTLIAALLCMALCFAGALAEGPDEPALKNPQERYEFYFEKTDGSEALIFGLMDAMNDEAQDIEAYGALNICTRYVDSDGNAYMILYQTLQNSEFGRMIINSTTGRKAVLSGIYQIEGDSYLFENGVLMETDDAQDFDFYWESYHFPYGPLEMLNGVRSDENYSYYLAMSGSNRSFEFVTDDSLRIVELRIYEELDGELTLTAICDYSTGSAKQVPPMIAAALRADALGR